MANPSWSVRATAVVQAGYHGSLGRRLCPGRFYGFPRQAGSRKVWKAGVTAGVERDEAGKGASSTGVMGPSMSPWGQRNLCA